ncbi:hypothetical protein, partial [Dactylosporangium matsuzakiense]|uniref:hypothetical protein n=1 Tax=Dactylosporangium matsuzakiense TaxID=53360 RepID=UPI0022F31C63
SSATRSPGRAGPPGSAAPDSRTKAGQPALARWTRRASSGSPTPWSRRSSATACATVSASSAGPTRPAR